jgi:hypothetical protein
MTFRHVSERLSDAAAPITGTVATGGLTIFGYTLREVNELLQTGAYVVSMLVGIVTVAYTVYKWRKGRRD